MVSTTENSESGLTTRASAGPSTLSRPRMLVVISCLFVWSGGVPVEAAIPADVHFLAIIIHGGSWFCTFFSITRRRSHLRWRVCSKTITSPAIPTIVADFRSGSGYTWIGSAYLLANATSSPVWGKLSDIWGRKAILLTAVAVFFIGSLLCAVSTNMPMFLSGRAIQGSGSGGVVILVNICITDMFDIRYMAGDYLRCDYWASLTVTKTQEHVPGTNQCGLGTGQWYRSCPRRSVHSTRLMEVELVDQPALQCIGVCHADLASQRWRWSKPTILPIWPEKTWLAWNCHHFRGHFDASPGPEFWRRNFSVEVAYGLMSHCIWSYHDPLVRA